MARTVLGPLCVLLLATLTVAAGTPPNLTQTLAAQRSLLTERPYDAAVHNDLGNLLVLDGRTEEAEVAYRRAIELEPANSLSRFNLGVLLQQIGRGKDAQAEFASLLEIDERNAKAHYQLGVLFESRGQRRKALDHYARAFAFDPSLTFARNNPHLLDNQLATEALLLSDRYDGDANADTPRLYDEPQRIVDLMLDEESLVEEQRRDEPQADAAPGRSGRRAGRAVNRSAGGLDGPAEDGSEDDEDSGDEDRRALTNQDLDSGSTLGQVRTGPNRRRPAIGTPGGRAGRIRGREGTGRGAASRPGATRQRANPSQRGADATAGSSTSGRASRPRYRPGVASTGRLELKLLPLDVAPEPTEQIADRGRIDSTS